MTRSGTVSVKYDVINIIKSFLSYRDWLDGAEEGVILVAFGSVSDSSIEVSMYVDRNRACCS